MNKNYENSMKKYLKLYNILSYHDDISNVPDFILLWVFYFFCLYKDELCMLWKIPEQNYFEKETRSKYLQIK